MDKPRITYSEFAAAQMKYPEHSIAAALEWRLKETMKPGARKPCESWVYALKRLMKLPIGTKIIPDLKPTDLIDHCRGRIAGGAKPGTVNSDMTAIRSTVSDYIASNDLPHEWLLVFTKARRLLVKEQLIGKSQPRDRLPTLEELALFRQDFAKSNEHSRCFINMVLVLDGLLLTGRRISELCRIERQHVNVAKKTYMVYNLKNSKGKGYHGEAALIEGAWEFFEQRLAEIPNEPTARLFPYSSKSCSQRTTLAKKRLQKVHPDLFKNLRMHDDRAYCFTDLLKKRYTVTQIQKGVSLHMDDKTLVHRYVRLTASDLHNGPAGAAIESRA